MDRGKAKDGMGPAVIVRNIAANAVGMVVTVAVQAALMIAAYRLAGPEQYGLIGVFGALLTAAAILDVGLGQTVVREMARRRTPDESRGQGAMLYTLQGLYIAIIAVLTIGLIAAAPVMARYWLRPGHLSVAEVQTALALMGVAIGIQRLRGLYQSTLDGLERQVLSNGLAIAANLLRLAVGLGALIWIAPTATAYFAGQILASLVETALFAIMAWRSLPPAYLAPRRFDRSVLHHATAFASANAAASALGTLVQVGDGLIISAVAPLSVFGGYALVSQLCAMMLRLATPLLIAVLPRLSLYVQEARDGAVAALFFPVSRGVVGLLASAAGVLIAFGVPILLLLTGQAAVAQTLAPVLAVLAAAYALTGMARPLHGLQLAEGDPATALRINFVVALTYLPLAALLTPRFGIATPATLLLVANALALPVFIARSFLGSLRGQAPIWLAKSLAWPVLAAGTVCILARWATPPHTSMALQILVAVAAGGVGLAVSQAPPRRHRALRTQERGRGLR